MTYKRKTSKQTLPRLEVPAEHEALREETPPDLKGVQYPHLPKVGQINGSPSDEEEVLTLLPAIGEPHPYPYYVSDEVNLYPAIQLINRIEVETSQSDIELPTIVKNNTPKVGKSNSPGVVKVEELAVEKLQQQFLELHASNNHAKRNEEEDEGNSLEDGGAAVEILEGPLEDEEEWLWPELDNQIRNVVWAVIEERVRMLPDVKAEEASKYTPQLNEKQLTAVYPRLYNKRANTLMDESILNDVPLNTLINELHYLSVQEKIMRNNILVQLQDDVISQQMADLILDASLKQAEKETTGLDDEERKAMPERL